MWQHLRISTLMSRMLRIGFVLCSLLQHVLQHNIVHKY
jgi:hypothetical protein